MHSSFVALNEHDLDAFVSCWPATPTETVCISTGLCKTCSCSAKSATMWATALVQGMLGVQHRRTCMQEE